MGAVWAALKVGRRVHDRYWDARLGIQTCGVLESAGSIQEGSSEVYAPVPTPYVVLTRLFDLLAPQPHDVIYDIGCGTGRVVCYAATLDIGGSLGVDIVPEATNAARGNLERVRHRSAKTCAVLTGDAATIDYDSATVLFLFNPFGENTMRRLLAQVRESWIRNPRPISLVYYNAEHADVLESHAPWLSRQRTLSIWRHEIAIYSASASSTS